MSDNVRSYADEDWHRARLWVSMERAGRSPGFLGEHRPPEPLLEIVRQEATQSAQTAADHEDQAWNVEVRHQSDGSRRVSLDRQFCGRVMFRAEFGCWVSVDRDDKQRVWSKEQDAIDFLTLETKAARTASRRRRLLGGYGKS